MSAAGEWTTSGIAFSQIGIAREDLIDVNGCILAGDEANAIEKLTVTIRQLEAARRMLRGW